MLLFIKGLIIGIGKIIPGVSGSLLAINFNVYEQALDSVSNFFSNWKYNLKFIITLGLGILISIIFGSRIIIYLLSHYNFITMMFFIGLISGGTYNFSKKIRYTKNNIIAIIIIFLIFLLISISSINNNYMIRDNFMDNIVFFFGGFIEIMASIVPGISGTALQMIMGIYDNVLIMISNLLDINYVFSNINLYLSFGIGMFFSFIICIYFMNYLLKKHKNSTYAVILSLCLASILILCLITFKLKFTLIEFIIGIMLLSIGLSVSSILDK